MREKDNAEWGKELGTPRTLGAYRAELQRAVIVDEETGGLVGVMLSPHTCQGLIDLLNYYEGEAYARLVRPTGKMAQYDKVDAMMAELKVEMDRLAQYEHEDEV